MCPSGANNALVLRLLKLVIPEEDFHHHSGTAFASENRIVMARFCHSRFFAPKLTHFCNLSPIQLEDLSHDDLPLWFLLVTIHDDHDYDVWFIPYSIIKQGMSLQSHGRIIVKIMEKDGKHILSGFDVTSYYRKLPTNSLT